ncbi:MAG: DNA primase [Candidatus Zixiibacteriota bacterium]|nr:MAG: DNA primase [candidate division Zixibacteria bacterium]
MPARLSPDLVDRIREATDIVDLISSYVQLERKGDNYFGLCPFHPEKTPSFSVHPGKGIFHCFGCGVGGNGFTFLQLHDKLSFAEAARELARRYSVALPEETPDVRPEQFDALYRANDAAARWFSRHLMQDKGAEFDAVREYLKSRGITADLARTFRLGYAPDAWDGLTQEVRKLSREGLHVRDFLQAGLLLQKNDRIFDCFRGRLMFPILNLSGKVVAFGGRTLKKEFEGGKYVNTPETPIYHKGSILYGLSWAREQVRRRGECLIVEGYMDLIRVHEGGFVHAVASSGTALTPDQARLLRRLCRRVILVFDGDAAGSHAAVRGGDVLLAAGLEVRVVGLPGGHDPDSFIRAEGPGAFGELIEKADDAFSYRVELFRREGRLAEIPSRTEVARELLDSLVLVSDGIQRELLARDLAAQVGLSTETMLRELAARLAMNKRNKNNSSNNIKTDSFSDSPIKERNLLEVLIRRPELRDPVFKRFAAKEFSHEGLRHIAERLENAWIENSELQNDQLISSEISIEEAKFISSALAKNTFDTLGIGVEVDKILMRKYEDYKQAHTILVDFLRARLDNEDKLLRQKLVEGKELAPNVTKAISKNRILYAELANKKFWEVPKDPSMDAKEDIERLIRKYNP